jgi:hypothetical protein
VDRASVSGTEGRGFESRLAHFFFKCFRFHFNVIDEQGLKFLLTLDYYYYYDDDITKKNLYI